MDRAFSVDDILESFWPASSAPPPPSSDASSSAGGAAAAMNRSSSEWFFQKFLEEASLLSPNSAPGPSIPANPNSGPPNPTPSTTVIGSVVGDKSSGNLRNEGVQIEPPALASNQPTIQMDPEKYAAHLKQQLEIYCKAVALSRGSNAVPLPQETPLAPDAKSQTSDSSQFGSQSSVKANSGTSVQNKLSGITKSASPAQHVLQGSEITIKPATSYSDQSEDDDLEGEAENLDHLDPAEAKKMRRMLSNRESARRSRRRKQAHLGELEQQVSQLRVENSSLLKNLQDINQKYTNAAVDNRVLKADVETLRAKVKMAEDKVKRSSYIGPVTSSVYQPTMTDMSPPLSVPYSNSPSDAASDISVPLHDDLNQYFVSHPPPPATQMATPHTATLNPTSVNMVQTMPVRESVVHGKTGRTPSMMRVASLEHLQKKICGQNGPIGPSGPNGLIGPSGPNGLIGPSGPNGLNGPSGLIGPSGPSGLIGPSGPSGPWDSLGPGGRGGQK